jgi:anti-sigma regulatory factor (Ser/Thr protein kinase)
MPTHQLPERTPPTTDQRPDVGSARPAGRWEFADADELPLLRRAVTEAATRSVELNTDELSHSSVHHNLALVTTELATNALKYGVRPGVVRLHRLRSGWMVDVADGRADKAPRPQLPQPGRSGGNGLLIVSMLTVRWGWYVDTNSTPRKHVWAEIADPTSGTVG